MTRQQLIRFFEAEPYQPFTIHMADRRTLPYPERGLLATAPDSRLMTVFAPGGRLDTIEVASVAAVKLDPPQSSHGKTALIRGVAASSRGSSADAQIASAATDAIKQLKHIPAGTIRYSA